MSSNCNPCKQTPVTVPNQESLVSALDNFIISFYGAVQKTFNSDGTVTWVLPCDLDEGLPGNPRLLDEGTACYLLRLINDGIVGLEGPAGPAGPTGVSGSPGNNSYSATAVDFVEPAVGANVAITLVNGTWLSPQLSVFIGGSGWYTVISLVGNTFTGRLDVSLGAGGTITAGAITLPAGVQGSTGPAGVGSPGAAGTNGVNAYSITASNFTEPSVGANVPITLVTAAWVAIEMEIFVEGSGWYNVISKAGNILTARLDESIGAGGTIPAGSMAVAAGYPGPTGPTGVTGNKFQFVFIRSVAQPATPTGNGIPVGWSATVPVGFDPIWASVVEQTAAGVSQTVWATPFSMEPTGDVNGPASSATGNIAVFADGTGKSIDDSGTSIPDIDPRGLEVVWIPAAQLIPSAAGGSSALTTVATGANHPDVSSLNFDPTTNEYAQFVISPGKSWDLGGAVTAEFAWSHAATTVNFGVVWGIQLLARINDASIDVPYGTAQEVTDGGGTTDDIYFSPPTAAIVPSGTAGDISALYGRVYRNAAAGGDTLAIDARLLGVRLTVTKDLSNDN